MKLNEALNRLVSAGGSMISNDGVTYASSQLRIKRLGNAAYVFNRNGMTKREREGSWKAVAE